MLSVVNNGISSGIIGCISSPLSKSMDCPMPASGSQPIVILASDDVAAVIVVCVATTVSFAANQANVEVETATISSTTINNVVINILFFMCFIFNLLAFY